MGSLLGLGGAVLLTGTMAQALSTAAPAIQVTAGPFLLAAVLGPGISLLAMYIPARIAGKVSPLEGMRPLVAKHCDFATSIPMFGQVESLNASVAVAIVLYELRRRWGPP